MESELYAKNDADARLNDTEGIADTTWCFYAAEPWLGTAYVCIIVSLPAWRLHVQHCHIGVNTVSLSF